MVEPITRRHTKHGRFTYSGRCRECGYRVSRLKQQNEAVSKATNEQLVESYVRLGSVWKVAKEFSMCGQSVWERVRRLGFEDKDQWTREQLEELRVAYSVGKTEPINIDELAVRIGKDKTNVSRKARQFGLTSRLRKKTEEVCLAQGIRAREQIKKNGHPRGGYKKGREVRVCPRCNRFFDVFPSSKQKYCSRTCSNFHRQVYGNQGYSKTGRRSDLDNQYFRSTYEANYARYLNFIIKKHKQIIRWEYEPETFEFKKIKKGTRFYTPDFKIYFSDGHIEYHEVKGWDYPKGRTARKRFLKYYPNLKLVLVNSEWFRSLVRKGYKKLIPNLE